VPMLTPPAGATGLASLWKLPDAGWEDRWDSIFVPPALKERLRNYVVFALEHGAGHSSVRFPVHRIALLSGPPGTGKTTLAFGVAHQAAQALTEHGHPETLFAEIDSHAFASELLGGSQRAVAKLLGRTIPDLAADGAPLVVLLDEIENLAVRRSAVSMEANPIDVHRATNAVLTGLDTLAQQFTNIVFLCTTNFAASVDEALVSRLDLVLTTALPDRGVARDILVDTVAALREVPPEEVAREDTDELETLLDLAEGLDARQLRKLALEGVISDRGLVDEPGALRWEHLVRLLKDR
jgi:pachytene checkpoint protein 2